MNYQNTNPLYEQMQKEIEKMAPKSQASERLPFYKFDPNASKTYYFRPLPSRIPGRLMPVEEMFVHYNFHNPNTERNGAFPCLSMFGLPCPLCEVVKQMKASTDPEAQAKAADFEATQSHYMYVLNMQEGKLGVLNFGGKRAFEAITGKFKEIVVENGITGAELDKGVVLQIDKTGAKQTTKYNVMVCERNHVLPQDMMAQFNDQVPLNEVYGKYTPDNYMKVLRGEKFETQSDAANKPAPAYQQFTPAPQQQAQPTYQAPAQPQQPAYQPPVTPQQQTYQAPVQPAQPAYQAPVPSAQPYQPPTQPAQSQPAYQPQQTQAYVPPTAPAPQSYPNPNAGAPVPSIEELQRMLGGQQ